MIPMTHINSEKNGSVHPSAIVDEGAVIGQGVRIWHFTHIMPGCYIGDYCSIGQNVLVATGVALGKNVKIQNNVSLYTGVICEDDVFLGPSVVFTNVINPRSGIPRKDQYRRTIVRKGASIGANATIICGVEIGEYAFIGAGAVVTHNVPAYALVYGNPARHRGWISEHGHKLNFDEHGFASCEESNQVYQKIDETTIKLLQN
jgi:UDP-2-acetamido-3-amino-2,3-dideoxy-glucuronate N-acetyltransferase